MKTLTIRGIDSELSEKLKLKARKNNKSLNHYVLNLLKETLGLSHTPKFKTYDDLDKLAGTWNEKDEKEFQNNIKTLSEIDRDIWN